MQACGCGGHFDPHARLVFGAVVRSADLTERGHRAMAATGRDRGPNLAWGRPPIKTCLTFNSGPPQPLIDIS